MSVYEGWWLVEGLNEMSDLSEGKRGQLGSNEYFRRFVAHKKDQTTTRIT